SATRRVPFPPHSRDTGLWKQIPTDSERRASGWSGTLWSDIGMYFQLRLDRELLQIWLTVRMAGDPGGVGTADSSTSWAFYGHVTDRRCEADLSFPILPRRFDRASTAVSSFPNQVCRVALIFVAHKFQQVAIRHQHLTLGVGERPAVSFWIVNRDLNIHMPEVTPTEPLHDSERIRLWVTEPVEPTPIAESPRLHNKDISLPFPNGVASPGWLGIRGKRPSV